MSSQGVALHALTGMPLMEAGDNLCAAILASADRGGLQWHDGDILVVAQKVVSKIEGRTRRLAEVTPSERALELARQTGKDPRLVEAVLSESVGVLRAGRNVLIVEHRRGHIMANAGIDHSNVGLIRSSDDEFDDVILLLPKDPDRSAANLRADLTARSGVHVGVVVSDSFGRPWRLGTVGVAIGIAGPPALIDRRGDLDLFGRTLEVTEVAFADAVAAAATLVMGEGAEGCPAVVVRGLVWPDTGRTAADVLRPADQDMFR